MISLALPDFGVDEILAAIGGGSRTSRVTAISARLHDAEATMRDLSSRGEWCTMPRHEKSIKKALADDIRYVYKSKLATKTGNARLFYNALRSAAPRSKCPICMERQVGALDHYLPKELWPSLAIVPENLYPICTSCNHRKSSKHALTRDEQYLHPYFDDLGAEDWLGASVLEEPGAPLQFFLDPPESWSGELTKRVERHYERFQLFEMYEENSVDMLGEYVWRLDEAYEAGDLDGVGVILADQARSMRHARAIGRGSLNRWPYVALEAWASSAWFVNNAGWRI